MYATVINALWHGNPVENFAREFLKSHCRKLCAGSVSVIVLPQRNDKLFKSSLHVLI